MRAKSLQSCPALCDPRDCGLPGSRVHGMLQARILEWAAIPLQGIFPTQGSKLHLSCLLHWQADSLPLVPPGSFFVFGRVESDNGDLAFSSLSFLLRYIRNSFAPIKEATLCPVFDHKMTVLFCVCEGLNNT